MSAIYRHSSAPRSAYSDPAYSLSALLIPLLALALLLIQGCTASLGVANAPVSATPSVPDPPPATAPLTIQPSSATVQAWQSIQFSLSGASAGVTCVWSSSSSSILPLVADEEFQGQQTGNATVSVVCGSQTAQATVVVAPQVPSGPITITSGGTYSGIWSSDDPSTPAVTVTTDDPVTIQDSVITSRGDIITANGVKTGANLTVENVTATALDPGVSGLQRGRFLSGGNFSSLIVKNCTMTGVSFGVYPMASTVSAMKILNNLAINLEDRASDGQGGLLPQEPSYGHFIILNGIIAPAGAEIAWNQVVQAMGQSSTTDVINIYRSQGASGYPIWVHDNYIQGSSSPAEPTFYGVGIIADGSPTEPVTAFARFEDNQIVHTAGSGVSIDNGHDITAIGNRVVSCGQDASGNWYAANFANAASIWDGYGTGPTLFYNNSVSGTAGGLVRPNSESGPMIADFWADATSMTYPGNSVSENDFTDPCLSGGTLDLAAESAEAAYWTQKVSAANQVIGDQHLSAQ